jgi:hypothetical protein
LSWQLQLGLARTNPLVTVLTNKLPFTGIVSSNGWRYFAVDVPCTNGWVTNTLTTDGPVDVFFNPTELPTGSASDVTLALGLNGTQRWVFPPPPLRPGRYFLGVRNSSATTDVNVQALAEVDCGQGFAPPPIIDVGDSGVTVSEAGVIGFTLRWTAAPLSEFRVEYTDSLDQPWVVIPVVVTSGSSEFSFTDDGTWTAPVTGTRFYRLLLVP